MNSIEIHSTLDHSALSAYLRKEVAPNVLYWDSKDYFPVEVVQELHELGVFAASLPSDMGGSGYKMIDLLAIASELGYYSPALVSCWLATMLAQTALFRFAHPALAKAVFSQHRKEKTILSFCATEGQSGSDVARMTTTAIPCDGGYRISGQKDFITNINYASHLVVFAKIVAPNGQPESVFSCFLVPSAAPGVEVGEPLKKLGQCESNTGQVRFNDVFVPGVNQIGPIGAGFEIISTCISRTKTLLAGLSVGICRRAMDEVTNHLGRTLRYGEPLLMKREIQAVLSEYQPRIEATWLLACKSGATWDATGNAVYESSVAKFFGADNAVKFVPEALELTGGAGYMRTSALAKLYRDVKVLEIYEGASLVLQSIMGREMFAPAIRRAKEAARSQIVREAA